MNPIYLLLVGLLGTGTASFGSSGGSTKGGSIGSKKSIDVIEAPADEKTSGKTDESDTTTTIDDSYTVEEPATAPTASDPTPETPTESTDGGSGSTTDPTTTPTVSDPTPQAPAQTNGSGSGGTSEPTTITGETIEVMAGRTTTLAPADDVTGVRLVSGVEHGTVSINPDNTFALVMTQSDFVGTQSFSYEATHADGSVSLHHVDLNTVPGVQQAGWATGESHYMLETDETGRVVVEAGDNHQAIYVTASGNGLSLSDIAAMEGMSTSQITGNWLAESGYGQTESTALDQSAGELLWRTFDGTTHSNWLLLESGYSYDRIDPSVYGASGESELHPIYVGSWGDGDRPILTDTFRVFDGSNNVVIQGLHFSNGGETYLSNNLIFDDIEVTGRELVTHFGSGLTVRNSYVHDISDPTRSYVQGHFANGDGILIENNLYDHNGWTDSYYTEGWGDAADGMSHNFYIDYDSTDVTVRDTISMRSSQTGLLIRPGGFIENNLVLDNNAGITVVGGDFYDAGHIGHYTLMLDNVITSAGGRQGEQLILTAEGIHDEALMTSYVDNVIAHMTNPDGSDQKDLLGTNHFQEFSAFYNDTVVWNWDTDSGFQTANGANAEGLDTAAMDATTIQNFTAQLLGDPNASIDDLAQYLRARAEGQLDDVTDTDLIVRFFQQGFGIAVDARTGGDTLRFVPDDLGDGIRWDNRLNWDTDDLPGLYASDSVDLGGNHVVYGSNTTIDTLDFGPGGALNVYGGRLTLTGGITGDDTGALNVEGAGQIWTEGSDAANLDVMVQGGRFANTGLMQNTSLTATGGQTILASGGAEFDLAAGQALTIADSDARVGFDGESGEMAILDMHDDATLAFSAQDGGFGTIEEFRSGAFGDVTDVQSGIDLGNATLSIDLAGLSAAEGAAFTLMDADEIVGLFGEASVQGLNGQNARIVIDYENDSVTLELSAGNGAVSVQTIGVQSDVTSGEEALWDVLTSGQGVASDTQQAMLPEEETELLDVAA